MKNEVAIIGYSGHAFVVLDLIASNELACKYYFEKTEKEYNPYNLIYGGDEMSSDVLKFLKETSAYLGIGSNNVRATIFNYLDDNGISMPYITHPTSIISPKATIGKATVLMPGCIINSMAKIGMAVICNTGSIVEHECILGDFVHIAPGAVLAGNVTVGSRSFIGANAVVRQGVTIGENVVIGAGSVVISDIQDNHTIYGNPAKQLVK